MATTSRDKFRFRYTPHGYVVARRQVSGRKLLVSGSPEALRANRDAVERGKEGRHLTSTAAQFREQILEALTTHSSQSTSHGSEAVGV